MDILTSKSPKAEIVRTLRNWIGDGVFEIGVPIPPELELCRRLDANQRTLQKAMKILEDEKLILRKGLRTRMVSPRAYASLNSGMLSKTILAVSAIVRPSHAHDSGFSDAVLRGILEKVQEAEYHALLLPPGKFSKEIRKLINQKPFGLLWFDGSNSKVEEGVFDGLLKAGIPVVAYGDDEMFKDVDRVSSDHAAGAHKLAMALSGLGRKRIMPLLNAGGHRYWVKGRMAGYEKAMREAGLAPQPILFQLPLDHAMDNKDMSARDAWMAGVRYHAGCLAEHIAAHGRPDAIMTLSDGIVFSVAAACRILGMEPGKDVEVVGYDNYWRESPEREFDAYIPPLTVDKFNFEMGHEMVRFLNQRKNGELPAGPQLRLIEPGLVKISSLPLLN